MNVIQTTEQQQGEEFHRPIFLTLICIFAMLGAVLNLVRAVVGPPSKLGDWFLPSLAVSSIVCVIAMMGVWHMRRWGVYTYIALCVVGQIALIVMVGHFNWIALVLRCAVVSVLLVYLRRMD